MIPPTCMQYHSSNFKSKKITSHNLKTPPNQSYNCRHRSRSTKYWRVIKSIDGVTTNRGRATTNRGGGNDTKKEAITPDKLGERSVYGNLARLPFCGGTKWGGRHQGIHFIHTYHKIRGSQGFRGTTRHKKYNIKVTEGVRLSRDVEPIEYVGFLFLGKYGKSHIQSLP